MARLGLDLEIYHVYSRFLFPLLRNMYDYTVGLLPIPSVYLLCLLILFVLYRKFRRKAGASVGFSLKTFLINTGNFGGWFVCLFYILWAFNYYRPGFANQINLPDVKIDSSIIIQEFVQISDLLVKERKRISIDSNELHLNVNWTLLENELRITQTKLLRDWGDQIYGRVRVRALYPKGLLLCISTAGVYIPFAFEGNIDAGLNSMQWPCTAAHEMAHGYGYTDEGVCNLIGFLSCMMSEASYIRYSGLLSYWKYLYSDVKKLNAEIANRQYSGLFTGVKSDLKAIHRDINKYPDILPELRDVVYDSYLKTNGIQKGLTSYNEIVTLVLRWKKSGYFFNFY